VTVHVAPVNDAPVAQPDSYSVVEDEPLDLTVFGPALGVLANDGDVDGDPLIALQVGDPAHGSLLLHPNGTFVYTPDADFFGEDSFTYQALDPSGLGSEVTTVTLLVENEPDPPVAFNVNYDTPEDKALVAALPVVDPDGDELAFEVLSLPSHGTLDLLDEGMFRYVPQADYFGPDSFSVRASDGGPFSGPGQVFIDVVPVNDPPILAALDDQEVDEGVLLSFTATATDVDVPAQAHAFSLGAGAPAGAAITSAGLFSWTPTEDQGPGSYDITIRVTDDTDPTRLDEDTFTVIVNETNLAPMLDPIGNRMVEEQTPLSFTATASDPDLPENGLAFSLVGAPAGASIDPQSGVFTWTPSEAQGPGDYSFDVVVTDDAADAKSDAETITVTVNEANLAPVLDTIGDRTVSEGELLQFTIGATDPDLPANLLAFSAQSLPAGASFDPATRMFSWMPGETQGPASYAVTFRVSDGTLSDEETIDIAVTEDSSLDAGPQANDGVPDTFRLVRNGADLEGYLNGALVFVRAFADVTDLSVRGSTDDDTLVVDFSGGDPLPASGLAYDGSGPGDHDTLFLTGGTAGSIVYTAIDAHSGTVSVDGETIAYTGLEPITDDLVAASRELVFGAGDDAIELAIAAGRTLLTSPSSETIDFANPTGTLTLRAGEGDDAVVVTGVSAYELLVDAGGGSNAIVSSVPVGVLVSGTEGADAIAAAGSADMLTLDVNGTVSTASGANRLVVRALGGDDTVSLRGLTLPAVVEGGEGDDTLIAGDAADILDGGPGNDTAVLKSIAPIAYWNLNETSGSAVADSAGAPQDGVFYGAYPDLDDPGPPASLAPFGAQTGADFHDSAHEYVAVAHDAAFEVAEGTIQLWFRTRDACDEQTLFAKDQDGKSNGLRIRLDDYDLKVQMEGGGTVHTIDTCGTAFDKLICADTWYQLTFTFGGAGMKLYVDGVLVGANAYAGGLAGNREAIVIGGSNAENCDVSGDLSKLKITEPFDGHIDEVAFYGVALAPEQIAQTKARGALGVIAPQDAADVLIGIECVIIAPPAGVYTAAAGAAGGDDVALGLPATEGWAELTQLATVPQEEPAEAEQDSELGVLGVSSAEPALFSVEGVELDEQGNAVVQETVQETVQEAEGLDGWIVPSGDAPAAPADEGTAAAPQTSAVLAIDWDGPTYVLGAPLSSGARSSAQPNFASFESLADDSPGD
jgi:hypothetical protein